MEQYKNKFKELINNPLNYQDIKTFFILYQLSKNDDLILELKEDELLNEQVIKLILNNTELILKLSEKFSLFSYRIFDYFKENETEIQIKNQTVKNINNLYNRKILNTIWSLKNVELTEKDFFNIEEMEKITLKKEKYFFYFLNKICFSNLKEHFIFNSEDTITLFRQVLLAYYDKKYEYVLDIKNLIIDDPKYKNFKNLLCKPEYQKTYYFENNKTRLEFKILKPSSALYNKDSDSFIKIKNNIKIFFYFLILNKQINLNALKWFFIIFNDEIPLIIQNDYYTVLFDSDPNISSYILKVLKMLNLDIFQMDEEFEILIKKIEEDNDYLGRLEEYGNNIEEERPINNFRFLEILKIINYNNTDGGTENSIFLKNIKLEDLNVNNLFIFLLHDPFKNSWIDLLNNVNLFENEVNFNVENYCSGDYNKLIKIFNTILIKSFSNNIELINPEKEQKFFSTISTIDFQRDTNINLKFFDEKILFYYLLQFLINYEIIPYSNKSLNKILSYISLEEIINFNPELQKKYNGYIRS